MYADCALFVNRLGEDERPDLMYHTYQIPFTFNTERLGYRVPDHATIARFRQANWDSMRSLFTEALRLCREAGLVTAGLIAIDGTKIAASASPKRNRSAEQIDKELAQLELELVEGVLNQAEAADREDDERLGDEEFDLQPDPELVFVSPDGAHGRTRIPLNHGPKVGCRESRVECGVQPPR